MCFYEICTHEKKEKKMKQYFYFCGRKLIMGKPLLSSAGVLHAQRKDSRQTQHGHPQRRILPHSGNAEQLWTSASRPSPCHGMTFTCTSSRRYMSVLLDTKWQRSVWYLSRGSHFIELKIYRWWQFVELKLWSLFALRIGCIAVLWTDI